MASSFGTAIAMRETWNGQDHSFLRRHQNQRDALALGRTLGELGGEISLAYVRHTQQPDRAREALEEKDAEELLERGAEALGDEKIPRHIVVPPRPAPASGSWPRARRPT